MKGLDKDQQEDLRKSYNASTTFRKRLAERLEEMKQSTIVKMVQEKDAYDNPSWAYKQAAYLAEIGCFDEISKIIAEK